MTLRRLGARREDRGAAAILFGVLMSALLMILAAIAVDLGMARSSKLSVQTSVDVSAISAATLLPATTDAEKNLVYQEVATYLNKESNKVGGQDGLVSATQLHDGDHSNGEVILTANPRTGVADTMRVIAPSARVAFGFAGALGVDGVDVTGEATVQVRTPRPDLETILPVWLPSSCVYGPLSGDAGPTPIPEPDDSPSYTQNTPQAGNNTWTTGAVSPASAAYATKGVTLRVPINNIPAGKLGAVVRITFGDTQYVDYRVTWPIATTAGDSRTVEIALDSHADAHRVPSGATVSNPEETWTVTSTAGTWEIWPLIPDGVLPPALPLTSPVTGVKFPKAQGQDERQGFFEVTGGGEVACSDSQRGNFGQLDSPRTRGPLPSTSKQMVYARNVAYGIDHTFDIFSEPPTPECHADGNPTGALIDAGESKDGRNCIYVDPGNDPQGLTDGLLGGGRIAVGDGRLEKPTNPDCERQNLVVGGRAYNNDTLSCYLKPGYTLADIAKDTGVPPDALDRSIFDSPRFFWVAVVHAPDRQLKKYLAIKTFAPVFLTDETTSNAATAQNGLVLNNGGQVQSMQLFGFNADALPVKPNADTTDYQVGTRKVVRLIN